ncbi:hypothetical protein NDU88_008095 [Pleurodeles waltl]|uniref:Uncharacterized protein n=1 Tax=Pleurodeles waltl TaxID=8319 RepID=A0AAV7VVN5_PLEWA|nr:hypothetical protein NDU88_008095 [Pleurodeles waltl]
MLWGEVDGGDRAWVGSCGDPGECRNRPVGEIGSRRPERAAEAAASRGAAIRSGVRADGSERRGTPGELPSGGIGGGPGSPGLVAPSRGATRRRPRRRAASGEHESGPKIEVVPPGWAAGRGGSEARR